jgi:phage-related minor tail protein
MFKIYAILAIVAIVGTMGTGAFVYVSKLQERVGTLQANNAKLEGAVRTQQETIKRTQEDAKHFQQLNTQLSADLKAAEAGIDQLRSTLANHDLTRLTLAKPGLIQTRINNATNELFKQLNIDTAIAPPVEPAPAE